MGGLPPDGEVKGVVFNIQRYSVHDGSGIRTLVFLKGCPLRCRWCSNPESQDRRPQLARNEGRCLGVESCDFCADVCPNEALARPRQGAPSVSRERCGRCMACAATCPAQALWPYGSEKTVRQVIQAVEQDTLFFARSEGGMTLSGGEPLMQADFALALLREGKRRHLDCAMETCGHVSWEILAEACGHLREVFFDLKAMDPEKHKEHTGVDNGLILANLRRLASAFPDLKISVRTPLVPSVNDTEGEIGSILDFLAAYPRVHYELLPYHRLGAQKYQFLDRSFPMGEAVLDDERLGRLRALVARRRGEPTPGRPARRGSDRAAGV